MVMIFMLDLPEHLAVPVHFQRRAAFECRLAKMTRIGDLTVVEKRSARREVAVKAGRVRHLPGVNDLTLHIDQVDRPVGYVRRRK